MLLVVVVDIFAITGLAHVIPNFTSLQEAGDGGGHSPDARQPPITRTKTKMGSSRDHAAGIGLSARRR